MRTTMNNLKSIDQRGRFTTGCLSRDLTNASHTQSQASALEQTAASIKELSFNVCLNANNTS